MGFFACLCLLLLQMESFLNASEYVICLRPETLRVARKRSRGLLVSILVRALRRKRRESPHRVI